jgi:hypothetical protein
VHVGKKFGREYEMAKVERDALVQMHRQLRQAASAPLAKALDEVFPAEEAPVIERIAVNMSIVCESHTKYVITVSSGHASWDVYKRYSELEQLKKNLGRDCHFPNKWINLSLKCRKDMIESFLQKVVSTIKNGTSSLLLRQQVHTMLQVNEHRAIANKAAVLARRQQLTRYLAALANSNEAALGTALDCTLKLLFPRVVHDAHLLLENLDSPQVLRHCANCNRPRCLIGSTSTYLKTLKSTWRGGGRDEHTLYILYTIQHTTYTNTLIHTHM